MKAAYQFLFGAVCLATTACTETDSFDVVGDPTTRLYINTGEWSPINAPRNQYQFDVIHTPVSTIGNVAAKFAVLATKPVAHDFTVGVALDNGVAEDYNTAYGTEYLPFPSNVLSLERTSVSFKQGGFHSADSVAIHIAAGDLALLTEPAYVAAVRMTEVSNGGAEVHGEHHTAYIVVHTSVNNIKPGVGHEAMEGTLIQDHSGWEVSSASPPNRGDAADLFDGSTNSYLGFTDNPVTMTIDMGDSRSLAGIRLFPRYSNFSMRFDHVVVETSEDGAEFTAQGYATAADMAVDAYYQHIAFYAPITTRYVRLTVTWGSSYRQLAELNFYVVE